MPPANHDDTELAACLKKILRDLPAPVGLVTSHDPLGNVPVGLAMSAIMPVSLSPCSMAVAINRSGTSHQGILRAGEFCINLLCVQTREHLAPFASHSRRDERFVGADWTRHGMAWRIIGAPANIFCNVRHIISHGTHDVLIGDVTDIMVADCPVAAKGTILGWANGELGTLAPLPA